MSEQYPFHPFGKTINDRVNEMAKHELFKVDLGEVDIKDVYLNAFPDGTNPIYRTNTEHDCTCCKNFLRNVGDLVAVVDGKLMTAWDVKGLAYPYDVVAAALHKAVMAAAASSVGSVWRTKEYKYGAQTNKAMENDKVVTWDHFWFDVPKKFVTASPGEIAGKVNSDIQVASRGLAEITLDAIDTVLDLVKEDALYRGAEHLTNLQAFRKLKVAYQESGTKQLFSYEHYNEPAARIRNTVIGTLLVDLSEGVDPEKAVKSFEAKVAPANYKRPKALITQGMIDQALKTIADEGLADSLQRRHATLADVHVKDVLWVSNGKAAILKGGVEALGDLLSKQVKQTVSSAASEVTIEEFMKLLPGFRTVEAFVAGSLTSNLMCVTAPVHTEAPALFKWDSGFGWSYNGGVADSDLRRTVASKGGRVDGALRFSHMWNYHERNASLMDLHVFMPGWKGTVDDGVHDSYGVGRRIGWNHRDDHGSGGNQDVDYTTAAPAGYVPVENISFPDIRHMPDGKYICKIHNWQLRNPTEGGFKAEIEFGGQVFQYEHRQPLKNKQWVTVAHVTLKSGQFTIEHKLPHGAASRDGWGLTTETWVPVTTIMLSPNFWQGKEVGNKHTFFMLEGCKNDEPVRGIYNEFLRPDLDKHRKVFEVLAGQTKVEVADEQLAGLGFSSTQRNSVTLRCTDSAWKQRQYKVNF